MPLDVVDGDHRDAEAEREPLGLAEADEEGPDETRPRGRRDEADVSESRPCAGERLVEKGGEILEVGAGRDLGDDASPGPVRGDLRRDDRGEDPSLTVDEGDRRLVAGGLDPERQHGLPEPFDGPSRAKRSRSAACGGEVTPRSVTIASTSVPGVTSKAG